ncbi:hypothetical protein V7S43_007619 [Phytophthora oleae]|uniref:Uncharacterized protein n=1 Tax=Phytophthora oleae TaxID=2107226 RepID=A0ABD3FKX0_9STRA
MDVSVMRSFKKQIDSAPSDALVLSGEGVDLVKVKTMVKGFRRAKRLPIGPRDELGVFETYLCLLPADSVVDGDADIEGEEDE